MSVKILKIEPAKVWTTEHRSSFLVMLCFTHLHSFPFGSFPLQTTSLYSQPSLTGKRNSNLFHHNPTCLTSMWPVPLKHTCYIYVCVVSVCVCFFIDQQFMPLTICSTWPHYTLPWPNYAGTHVHFAYLYFLVTLSRSVVINHPWVLQTAPSYTCMHIFFARVPL